MLGVIWPGWAELGSIALGLLVSSLYKSVWILESSIEICRSKKLHDFSVTLCFGESNLIWLDIFMIWQYIEHIHDIAGHWT